MITNMPLFHKALRHVPSALRYIDELQAVLPIRMRLRSQSTTFHNNDILNSGCPAISDSSQRPAASLHGCVGPSPILAAGKAARVSGDATTSSHFSES